MKNVYVVLSATPTIMGTLIRRVTGNPLNHVSISLTDDWSQMYSFARYSISNPWVGGFVREFPKRLSLGKDKTVFMQVYKIPVSDEQYDRIRLFIKDIREDSEKNIYNSIAALGLLLGWEFKVYKSFTCTDFVAAALMAGNVDLENYVSKNILPYELSKLIGKYIYFKGYLSEYKIALTTTCYDEDFFKKYGLVKGLFDTLGHFRSLYSRRLTITYSDVKNYDNGTANIHKLQ